MCVKLDLDIFFPAKNPCVFYKNYSPSFDMEMFEVRQALSKTKLPLIGV